MLEEVSVHQMIAPKRPEKRICVLVFADIWMEHCQRTQQLTKQRLSSIIELGAKYRQKLNADPLLRSLGAIV